MGRAYRKQAMGILDLLKEMQEGVQKAVRRKDIQLSGQLLAEMQEAAIALGTSIEAHLGEGTDTVKAIEEYCELVYQVHTVLGQGHESETALHKLCNQWRKIRHSAEGELSNQYEMVFLPYKASMWDSLESVWRAADGDPACDAYVIPIPYYDKNSDGTFRSEHYEGEEFPEDVPITHYLEYDLEGRHPDVIFIHNPYDDHNYVTSVHPYFYTQKLKECADKLVYIPYYVSEEINPDNKDVIKGKAAMTLTNGVFHSDMVFLQSENTKRLFVNILTEYIQDIDRSYWEKKIWGLGSPKLDRVNRVVRDDARLPQNWYDRIYTESGLRKKVIFYNISISTLLKNPDMLNKIKDVLMFFKNNEDLALWWRPHPLYESTLASMRPDMLAEYQQLVNQYKQEGWGIFDDGVDLQWAIAETDAYYGDKSSVIQLFKEVGKPVMIQDVTVRTQQEIRAEDIPIWPSAFCVDGDDIWFVHGKMSVLMKYSMKEKHTYVIGAIPNEEMFQESSYRGIYKWDNKIFLVPCGAREIAVYDSIDGKFIKIPLKNIERYNKHILFCNVYEFGKYLYCIPYYYKAVLRIDLESSCVKYIPIEGSKGEYIGDATRVGNEIAAIYSGTNQALFLNVESDTVFLGQLGSSTRRFTNITNIDNKLYLFDENTHSIIKVSGEKYSEEEEFRNTTYEAVKMARVFPDMFTVDSVSGNEMQVVNAKNEVIFQEGDESLIQQGSLGSIYYAGIGNDSYMGDTVSFYFSKSACSMYQFRSGSLEEQFTMFLDEDELSKLSNLAAFIEDEDVNENDVYEVKIWIKKLEKTKNRKEKVSSNCGEKILQVVKTK